jgi:hypothetical protein
MLARKKEEPMAPKTKAPAKPTTKATTAPAGDAAKVTPPTTGAVPKPKERGKIGDFKADLEWRAEQGDLYARRILVEHKAAEASEHELATGIKPREE